MALASRENLSPPQAATFRGGVGRPLAAAVGIEAVLILGLLLPLRMDVHPPSLQVNLARVYGTDLRGLALYLVVASALLLLYAVAVRLASGLPRSAIPPVLTATAVLGATLLPVHPTYSSDVFHYVATARVGFAHGENPHVTSPEEIEGDPLMALSGWKWLPSPYGPGWTWLSALPYAASGGASRATGAVLAFKMLAVLALVLATAGIALAAERLRPGSGAAAAVAFGWNPLVLVHLAGDGHNDAAMLALLAWGVFALAYRRPGLALALFGCACLIKAAAGLALAVLAIGLISRARWRPLVAGLAVPMLLGVLLIAPYWAGLETFRAMLDEGRYFTNTLASLAQRLLEPALGGDPARVLVGALFRSVLLAIVVVVAWRAGMRPLPVVAALASVYLLAVTVLGTWYQPWYATWPLLFLAVLAPGRAWWFGLALALTVGGLLVPVAVNFVAAMSGLGARDALIDALAVGLVLAPIGFVVVMALRIRASRRRAGGMAIG
jgi:alpha-1,6-mannosyltransferase